MKPAPQTETGSPAGTSRISLVVTVSDGANKLVEWLLIAAGTAICLILFAQVISRYLGASLGWSEEVSRHLLVAITFLGATAAYKKSSFIGLRGIGQWLGHTGEKWLGISLQLLTLGCFGLLSWFGILYTSKAASLSTASLQIPMAIPFAVIPAAAAIMVLHCLAAIITTLRDTDR